VIGIGIVVVASKETIIVRHDDQTLSHHEATLPKIGIAVILNFCSGNYQQAAIEKVLAQDIRPLGLPFFNRQRAQAWILSTVQANHVRRVLIVRKGRKGEEKRGSRHMLIAAQFYLIFMREDRQKSQRTTT
jgi:hypothetical protein